MKGINTMGFFTRNEFAFGPSGDRYLEYVRRDQAALEQRLAAQGISTAPFAFLRSAGAAAMPVDVAPAVGAEAAVQAPAPAPMFAEIR